MIYIKKMQNITEIKKLAINKMALLIKIVIDKKRLDISIKQI